MKWQKGKLFGIDGVPMGDSAYYWESEYGYRISLCLVADLHIYTLWSPAPRDILKTPYYSLEAAKAGADRHFYHRNKGATPPIEDMQNG